MKKLILILPFVFLLSLFFVNAAETFSCGFQGITNNAVITNNTNITVSYVATGANASINVSFSAISPSTQNSSVGFIGNASNVSGNRDQVNMTFANSTILQDSNDYTLNCACIGGGPTGSVSATCNSTITVQFDRTKPAPPTAITFTNPLKDGDVITATINRGLANRCFIRFGGPTVSRTAMTLSGSTCTYTVRSNSPPNSDYQAFFEADDRTNSTLSAVQYVTIKATASDGGGLFGGTMVTTQDSQSSGQSFLGGGTSSNPFLPNQGFTQQEKMAAAFIIVLAAFLYFKNKK